MVVKEIRGFLVGEGERLRGLGLLVRRQVDDDWGPKSQAVEVVLRGAQDSLG